MILRTELRITSDNLQIYFVKYEYVTSISVSIYEDVTVCECTSVDSDILALDRVSLERRGTSPVRRIIAGAGSGGRGQSDHPPVTCASPSHHRRRRQW